MTSHPLAAPETGPASPEIAPPGAGYGRNDVSAARPALGDPARVRT
jgi:hypothetical protein